MAARGMGALCAMEGIASLLRGEGGLGGARAAWAQDPAPPVAKSEKPVPGGEAFTATARHWDRLADGNIQCHLCPNECEVKPGERGTCGVRQNQQGEYKTLIYGRVVSLNVDPIEKKPLSHFLPGTSALSLAAVGCNLNCQFCQNWQISQAKPEEIPAVPMSPEAVAKTAKANQISSIAYTYTEPTVSFEFMIDTARAARPLGVRNVMISNGYIRPKPLLELCGAHDAIKVDFKGFNPTYYRDICRGELQPVLETLETIHRSGTWLELVVLVIPTLNDTPGECKRMCEWVVERLGPDVPIHFSRFSPNYKLRNLPATPTKTLERNREIARKTGIRYAYIGNVPGHEYESTFCPGCGVKVIKRYGFVSSSRLKSGACPDCGFKIAGVW